MSQELSRIKVVSFDAEGTLATHAYSRAIWREIVPQLYGSMRGLSSDEASARVFAEYQTIGHDRVEWYDIGYWFRRFELGNPAPVMERYRSLVELYSEVPSVLRSLNTRFVLVVASSTPLEFLEPMLRDVRHLFGRVFSSTSQCGRLKDEAFFRWTAKEMGVRPADIVHVGDNWERDYISASAAGCVAIFLDRAARADGGITTLEELEAKLNIAVP